MRSGNILSWLTHSARVPFWVKRSAALRNTWEIIRQAAATGRALVATRKDLERCGSLDEAVERYADKLASVDRSHRLFEQRAHALVASDLEDYDALLEVRTSVRRAYREWANGINRNFFELCVSCGALPDPSLRQRTVYDHVVHPLVEQGGHVAFILVDALRFEMAQGFVQDLKRDKYNVSLSARLAELPTDTVIGMNALAPVERNGRLRLVMKKGDFVGFAAGECWADLIVDEGYRRVLQIVEERRSINEAELQQVLGSPQRVRAFSRRFDALVKLISFEVEVCTVNGMKAYVSR